MLITFCILTVNHELACMLQSMFFFVFVSNG